jgi:CRISPR-associated endonuclease Cas1
MQPQSTSLSPTQPSIPVRHGVAVLYGYGIKVSVSRRHLICEDGIARERRWGRFHPATAGLKRLVVLGTDGLITLDAVQWLHAAGAALITINHDADVILTSARNGPDHPRLRRAQALAAQGPLGLDLTRALLAAKLRGQAAVLESLSKDVVPFHRLAEAIGRADTLSAVRLIESQAAVLYWAALEAVPFPWNRQDAKLVPAHWGTIGPRSSPLTHSPRRAVTPAHAILNYAYALLEAEARLACMAVGLDPGLGLLHADQGSRDSLALDLMEAARPAVDAWWLDLLQRHVFARRDFSEQGAGDVRCTLHLKPVLAETVSLSRQVIAPWAEWCAGSLTAGRALAVPSAACAERLPVPTRLTQSNRSRGRDSVRVQPAKIKPATPTARLDRRLCQGCGIQLSADGRRAKQAYCAECREMVREKALSHFQAAGPATLARQRAEGPDASHSETAQARRRETQLERARARASWALQTADTLPQDIAWSDVLAGLASVSLGAMRQATGLSLSYCAQIKQGQRVPHASHWRALSTLAADVEHSPPSNVRAVVRPDHSQ